VGPDFAKLTGFEWDDGNATKSLTKHRVTGREAEEIFGDPGVRILHDPAHSGDEARWKAFGRTLDSRCLTVSFTVRGSLVRVISARPMNRKERKVYGQENAE
jgi:uncharacterized DUF497 family protein